MHWVEEMVDYNQQQQPCCSSDTLHSAACTDKQDSASTAAAAAPTKALAATDLNTIIHQINMNTVSATEKVRISMSVQCRQEASNSDLCTTTTTATTGKMQKKKKGKPNGSIN